MKALAIQPEEIMLGRENGLDTGKEYGTIN